MKHLTCLPIIFCTNTYALDFEGGIHYTKVNDPVNGTWWQDPFENSFDNTDYGYHIGLRFKTPWDNLDFLVGYKDLGDYSSTALASASDPNYAAYQKGTEDIWPLSEWHTKSEAEGIYLLGEYTFLDRYFIKLGTWYHKVDFSVHIPDWRPTTKNGYGDPRPLTVNNYDASPRFGSVYGVGVHIGDFDLSYELWTIDDKTEWQPAIEGRAQSIVLNYRF